MQIYTQYSRLQALERGFTFTPLIDIGPGIEISISTNVP